MDNSFIYQRLASRRRQGSKKANRRKSFWILSTALLACVVVSFFSPVGGIGAAQASSVIIVNPGIPEPSTTALLALAAGAVLIFRRNSPDKNSNDGV